jgi:hypothetical protein
MTSKPASNQGEGDRASAARYNEDQQQFVRDNDASSRERMAREAQPASGAEARELQDAEAAGRARAKADDAPDAMTRSDRSDGSSDSRHDEAPQARGGADASEGDTSESGRPGGAREARGRDEHARRRGRFLRRRR